MTGPSDSGPDATTAAVERWFVRQGLPHLVPGYGAPGRVLGRSIPVLVALYLVGTLATTGLARNWGDALASVALLIGVWVIANIVRGQRPFAMPRRLGVAEVFVFGPGLADLVVQRDAMQAIDDAVVGLVLLAVVYIGTSYAVVPLVGWGLRRSLDLLPEVGTLLVRALPMVLFFSVVLFLTGEVWQVAGTLKGAPYVLTLVLLFLVGASFLLTRVPGDLAAAERFETWADVAVRLDGTPLAGAPLPTEGTPPHRRLTRRQRANLALAGLFTQAVQITGVAAGVFGFFVTLVTDATYRSELRGELDTDLSRALAVRLAEQHRRAGLGAS